MPFNFGLGYLNIQCVREVYQGGEIEWLISEYCRSTEEESAEF